MSVSEDQNWEVFESEHREFENDPLDTALELLDDTTEAYYNACGAYARRPSKKNISAIVMATNTQIEAFGTTMEAMGISTVNTAILSTEEFATASVEQINEQNRERDEYFNKIIGNSTFKSEVLEFTKGEDWDKGTDTSVRAYLVKNALETFAQKLSSDTDQFIEIIRHETEAGKRIQQLEMCTAYGLEIGRVAIGTVAGIMITRAFSRKR